MKTLYFAAALILCGTAAFAQVGINTSTPNAQLDIRSSNQAAPANTDGMLIPKVDAFPAANPTAAQQGMLVYLTTASGGDAPGFYFWDNVTSGWISIGGSGKGWDLNGNTGTNPTTNFLGTADAQPLTIKTDNAERMRIDASGSVGIGTATPFNKFHVYSGASGMTPNPFSVATLESTVSSYLSVLSGGETGVLFGANGNSTNGAIVYNNPGLADGMLFRTAGNVNRMVIGPTGNIGFGDFVPSYPLHFQSTLGDKIALWGGAGVHYGIGIQNSLLQIHSDGAGSDIAFGYGSSAAMTETMRVKGNGRVGVGIGLPNARMEVAASSMATPASTDGLIIPRINAFPAANPNAAQNGMLVFLTTTVGAFQPGFYYWNNATTSWKGIGSSGTPNDWGLAGNAGTTAANNFIGTTDDNDIIFKRNNLRSGIIGATNTSFGSNSLNPVTTGTNNTAVGINTLLANTTGFRNIAIGGHALASNLTGSYSTAVGKSALANNTTGGSNTAVGDAAMVGNIGGAFNVGVGNNTLTANTEGDGNTALGHRAMFANILGNNNTAVGLNALYNNQASGIVGVGTSAAVNNTTGQYNTAVGSYALQNNSTGGFNTAVGYNAALGNTGGYNTALGVNALYGSNTASGVTAIGHASMYSNTSGLNNTAVGNTTLNRNTTGNNNTAMGASALYWNNGEYNTAYGSNSLVNNSTGYDNSANGAFTLTMNSTGFRNTAQGGGSLYNNTIGYNNTASGYYALVNNQIGNNNTALGAHALQSNSTGNDNTAVGLEALKSTTVSGGTAVGMQSLFSNVDGLYNTAVGTNSLRSNISGSYNTATGYNALIYNTGTYNTAMGVNSLLSNTTGNSNTALGYRTLYHNTTAGWNTAIGDAAMYENIDGEANSVLGHHALQGNTTGSYNTVMGVNALYHNPSGDNNTALGHSAMANVNPGSNNTAVGASAMITQTAGDNNIAIGVSSALPSLTGSNQLSIGNVIYGSAMNTTATGKIGIGKAVPDAKLEIAASNAAAPANTDGLLIPRVNTFPVVNPTAAQNGMMVYLTTALGLYPAGFYYWDNAAVSWTGVGTKNNWSTSGNAGTNPAVQYIGTSDNKDLSLRTNGNEVVRLTAAGNAEVDGFTKLGATAPAIKNLKLTGTTASTQGSQVGIAHGLTSSKILSVSVMVEWSAGQWVPASYGASLGYEFDYFISTTAIQVINKTANSANILSKAIKILVTYEQ